MQGAGSMSKETKNTCKNDEYIHYILRYYICTYQKYKYIPILQHECLSLFSTNNQLLYSKWVWIPLLQYIVPYDQWANILIIATVNFLKYLLLNLEIEFFWKKAHSLVHISRSFQDRSKGLLVGSRKLLKELKVYAWIRKTWLCILWVNIFFKS